MTLNDFLSDISFVSSTLTGDLNEEQDDAKELDMHNIEADTFKNIQPRSQERKTIDYSDANWEE